MRRAGAGEKQRHTLAAIKVCLEFSRNQVALFVEMIAGVGLDLIDPKSAVRSGPITVLPPTLQVLVSLLTLSQGKVNDIHGGGGSSAAKRTRQRLHCWPLSPEDLSIQLDSASKTCDEAPQ